MFLAINLHSGLMIVSIPIVDEFTNVVAGRMHQQEEESSSSMLSFL